MFVFNRSKGDSKEDINKVEVTGFVSRVWKGLKLGREREN